jgi:hypothetical protein
MAEKLKAAPADAMAGATPYLRLFGTVAGGHFLTRGALKAATLPEGDSFAKSRLATGAFYAGSILSGAAGLKGAVMDGAAPLYALDEDELVS